MALTLGKWSIGKSNEDESTSVDKAKVNVINQLLDEQKILRGEIEGDRKLADIDANGTGQVKIFYRYVNLLGKDNCAMVGPVSGESELADKIDEVIELIRSSQLNGAIEEALIKVEKEDKRKKRSDLNNSQRR